jgi:hypothetical protein
MRKHHLLTAFAGFLTLAAPALGQTYPAEAVILQPEVEVRSGPSKVFFATSKLKQGDKVLVLRESKESQGWLEIKPPPQSFSWINAKYLKQLDALHAAVVGDASQQPAPILPGSRVVDQPPNRESMKLTAGTVVIIVDRPLTVGTETWVPIQPHQNEVRYLPADAVRPATVIAAQQNGPANWTLTPQGYVTNPALGEAQKAEASGDYNRARQLYQQIYNDSAADTNQRIYAANRLNSMPASNFVTTSNVKPNETRTAMSPSNVATNLIKTKEAAWSQYGRLYETKVLSDSGQPLYTLDMGQGQTIYVSTNAGKSLQSYVGRTICVYGPTMYRPDSAAKLPYVVATHVAVP